MVELEQAVLAYGEPAFRARQLEKWIYRIDISSFLEMTDLPLSFREKLTREYQFQGLAPLAEITSADGRTKKVLFKLADEETIESVIMHYGKKESSQRCTICVSTQVGCPVGCPFCATGQQGFKRNLTPGEVIDQVLYFARQIKKKYPQTKEPEAPPVDNVVFMGMGEPLLNYQATCQAIENLKSPQGFGLGARRFTISTVGLIPQIKQLARQMPQVGLAISLHAPSNSLRDQLIPLNKKYPLEELMAACREYVARTGRRISFEYVLFQGLNDSPEQARDLASLLKDILCHINLIPANPTEDSAFRAPSRERVLAFRQELEGHHIATTVRLKRGVDIEAGCGQLRSRYENRLNR